VIFLATWHCILPIGPLKNAADANWQPIGADRFEEVIMTIGEQLKSFCQFAHLGYLREKHIFRSAGRAREKVLDLVKNTIDLVVFFFYEISSHSNCIW
jgi:hypothetical protein